MTGTLAKSAYVESGDGLMVFFLLYAVMAVMMLVATAKILHKAGYSAGWVLVTFVPFVNVIMYIVFAFADWPALRAARHAQQPVPYPPRQP